MKTVDVLQQLVDERVRALLAEYRCTCHTPGQKAGAPPRTAYSVLEVATSIGYSKRHVYDLIRTGELHAIRSGRRVVVPVEALAEYLRTAPAAS